MGWMPTSQPEQCLQWAHSLHCWVSAFARQSVCLPKCPLMNEERIDTPTCVDSKCLEFDMESTNAEIKREEHLSRPPPFSGSVQVAGVQVQN